MTRDTTPEGQSVLSAMQGLQTSEEGTEAVEERPPVAVTLEDDDATPPPAEERDDRIRRAKNLQVLTRQAIANEWEKTSVPTGDLAAFLHDYVTESEKPSVDVAALTEAHQAQLQAVRNQLADAQTKIAQLSNRSEG